MDENVMLRCKYCGAPFETDSLDANSPYVTCTSCGTSQQRVDARAYLDQLMGQVQSWISSAIPTGFNMAQADNVDAVARHNIFMRNIQPRIETGLMEYKFSNNSLLANGLLVLPFMAVNVRTPSKTSAQAFEFNASVKSVSALAVDDASSALVSEAAASSQMYALMMNNTKLMAEDKEGRYILMANNFSETARIMKDVKGYGMVHDRFEALADVCNGIAMLMEGDTINSGPLLRKGIGELEAAKAAIMTSPEFGIMYQAVEQELAVANAMNGLLEMILNNPSMDAMKTISVINQVMKRGIVTSGVWANLSGNMYRYTEVFEEIAKVFSAKTGDATIRVAAGGGSFLMPFWEIDLEYSMVGGGFLSKKSVEINETLLAPADFITDGGMAGNPAYAMTDIFAHRTGKKDEGSISERVGLTNLTRTIQNGSAGARKVVLPLSTRKEASKLASEYLAQRMRADSKMKLGKPRVKELVYIPCEIGDRVTLPKEFGALIPARVANTSGSMLLYV